MSLQMASLRAPRGEWSGVEGRGQEVLRMTAIHDEMDGYCSQQQLNVPSRAGNKGGPYTPIQRLRVMILFTLSKETMLLFIDL